MTVSTTAVCVRLVSHSTAVIVKDKRGHRRVGPEDRRTALDVVWPRLHARWWNFNSDAGGGRQYPSCSMSLKETYPDGTKDMLEQVEEIAESALNRAEAADRRASTIAGSVAIAASFTLTGAGLVLDHQKVTNHDLRRWLAILLC